MFCWSLCGASFPVVWRHAAVSFSSAIGLFWGGEMVSMSARLPSKYCLCGTKKTFCKSSIFNKCFCKINVCG
ncbi:hypothetical protein XENTR_v10008380 [Xenopus tropicalis]|nr:hypothetical protein XENTR_v10008380 [Xenopus tropicalis]